MNKNIEKCIENLAPIVNGENQDIYIELLKNGIKDPKVKNIALSGPYGSGKSSIIQKFLSTPPSNEKRKFLEISLADFDNNIDPKEEECQIEKSILQQIFYKVPKKELPYSRLERTEQKRESNIVANASVFFIWLISFYSFVKVSEIKQKLIDVFALQDINIQTLFFVLILFPLLISTFYIVYLIVKGTGKIKLNKLSFQGTTLELNKEEGSLINRYLDEILYFFEATTYEVLIIEDLDRVGGTKIFQKLREVNILLNNYTKINEKKKITFIYAAKDSIFKGEERTKFFELIIPVVPIINTSNAKDILIQKFKDIGLLDKVGEDFLKNISYYIHNYRQLANIVNEFCIYQEAIKNTQDYRKLFALIAYKNFFPQDFSELQNRKGILYNVFHERKEELVKGLISSLDDKITDINNRLADIDKEHLENKRELKIIFASKLFKEVNNMQSFWQKNSPVTIDELVDNSELFNQYVVIGGLLRYYKHNNPYPEQAQFQGDQSGEYATRLKVLHDKKLEKQGWLTKEKEDIQNQIREIKYAKLSELLEKTDNMSLLDNGSLKDKVEDETNWQLVKQLLIGGYIDEEYGRYISYFHEGTLTRNDYDFIIGMKEGSDLNFSYPIDNQKAVLDELSLNDLKKKVENFSIAEYLFQIDEYEFQEKRNYFINNFFEKSSKEFIRSFVEKNTENRELISVVVKEAIKKEKLSKLFDTQNPENIKDLLAIAANDLQNSNLQNNDKEKFDSLLSKYIFDIYTELENKEAIKHYIIQEEMIFDELDDIKFKQTKELFEFIYKNSLYELTCENIKSILVNLYDFKLSEEYRLKTSNLTAIRESDAKNLIDDIDQNINEYFENCWIKLQENKKETEETFIYMLNHGDLKHERKEITIETTEETIVDVLSIAYKSLWNKLIQENKIDVNWDNVFAYYAYKELLDEALFDFLNRKHNTKQLSLTRIGNKYFEEHQELKENGAMKLLREILESNGFENENYQNLIKSNGYWYDDLNLESLDFDKIKILIHTGKLMPKEKSYKSIREKCLECAVLFIEYYKDKYFEKTMHIIFDADVTMQLINSTQFTIDEKFKIIEDAELELFDDNIELKEKVSELYILNDRKIENLDLFEKLFYGNNQYSLELLVSQIQYFEDCDNIHAYLNAFDKPYNELLEKRASKLYLEDTEQNISLLDKLREKNCISSYKTDSKKNKIKVERKRV